MRSLPLIALVALACALSSQAFAQSPRSGLSNLRRDTLPAGDTLRFARGSVFATTISATDAATGETLVVDVRAAGGYSTVAADDGVRVAWSYRRFDTELREPIFRLDSALLTEAPLIPGGTEPGAARELTSVSALRRDLGAVDYRGTFGRGLRFGNSQNLVLDSQLDLQLSGDLGGGLTVDAVVSDQNIPLQPEGNTVQLQEFDRVFVTIARDPHALTGGDYALHSDRGRFLRFDKNLQGLAYQYRGGGDSAAVDGRAALAAARGEFARIRLPLTDGNQGPYRLTGSRGEAFVIVLAGTERVTLDGRLLTRGIDRDYVIDYNRGEITFTPRLLVNRFQRVVVEYEYSDREYLRSLLSAEAGATQGKWTLYAQGFQQQDALRRTGAVLSAAAEEALRGSDGGADGVLVPSATRLAEGSASPVRYRAVAAVELDACAEVGDTAYAYAPLSPTDSALAVVFTDVGAGAGDYRLAPEVSGNGAVFEYVARGADCEPSGRYAPLRRVRPPRGLRVVTFGGEYRPDSTSAVRWETAASQRDDNRYNATATGAVAGYLHGDHAWAVAGGELSLGGGIEGTSDGFEAVAPWRGAEFKRVWNLGALATAATLEPGAETLTDATVDFARGGTVLGYGLEHYRQETRYTGLRHRWLGSWEPTSPLVRGGRWSFTHAGNHLDAERAGRPTGRTELEATAARRGPRWRQDFGARTLRTLNYDAVLDATTDTDRRVREWWASTAQVAGDTAWSAGFAYRGRADALLEGNGDAAAGDGVSHEAEITLGSPAAGASQLNVVATYRNTQVPGAGRRTPGDAGEDYYLGRATHRYRASRGGWLRTQSSLEAGSGQERRAAVQYVRVQPGLGEYAWQDYDGDGVEDLGEFELARFADSARYIRAVALTDEFVPTNTLTANQTLDIDLSRLPQPDSLPSPAITGVHRRLSALSTASLRRRALQSEGYTRLLAVNLPADDTTVVGDDLAWRTALYVNRARDAFRAELEHRQLASRSIRLQGLQQLRTTGQRLELLQPLGEALRVTLEVERERRRSRSEGLAARDYLITTGSITPGLRWQPGAYLRAVGQFAYREAANREGPGAVRARTLSLEVDASIPDAPPGRRAPLAGATVRARVERISQTFRGEVSSPAGFALLQGLRPGRSWLWNASVDQQLGRALRLTLRYEGRQVAEARVVHSGQAQVQAIF